MKKVWLLSSCPRVTDRCSVQAKPLEKECNVREVKVSLPNTGKSFLKAPKDASQCLWSSFKTLSPNREMLRDKVVFL